MLIQLIADYGTGDLAFAEVQQRLHYFWPDARIVTTSVAPFDTLAASFLVAQLALNPGPEEMLVYHNVAPRFDDDDPRHANAGEELAAGQTQDGVWVIGPNSGEVFSLIRPGLISLNQVNVPAHGSQFRSRDIFPQALFELIEQSGGTEPGASVENDAIGPVIETVPEVPEGVILYTDGYGNIKTSWRNPPVQTGQRVLVRIGDTHHPAVVSDGSFAVGSGELAFAPGSSGWRQGSEFRFYELFLRGASAASRFGHPAVGTKISLDQGSSDKLSFTQS